MPTDGFVYHSEVPLRLSTCSSNRPLLAHHVARRLGLSARMVRHLAATQKLRGFKVGKKIWHFFPDDVEAFQAWRRHLHVR